jgi:UDP-glucose 4-epimerase
LNNVCLRYFNACGADLQQRTGEAHEPESHLIPIVLQVANGDREFLQVNGQDYNTEDGTCVRDFIHTLDLASAHVLALKKVLESTTTVSQSINLGTKNGYSISQVIEVAKKVTGKEIPLKYGPRRSGDPDQLIADNSKALQYLGWKPEYSDLETIIDSAWKWYQGKGRDIQARKAKLALEEMV